MELIECTGLSFSYPGCERLALRELEFSVRKSEFVLLCGRSGCGKSTLLRHMKKSLMPYGHLEGSIKYSGIEIEALPDRVSAAEIGFVQQSPDNQIVTDKVWHELAFGLESLGMDRQSMLRRVAEMASFFGIETWFRKDVSRLSGGQKQLLNLASIMAMKPKLIILDEPTSQLDPIAASDFIAALRKINTELGTTIIISEHRLEELFPIADRVLVMDEGRIVIDDTPRAAASRMAAGECSAMFHGLPAVVKIALAAGEKADLPVTVREGRLWLESRLGEPAAETNARKPKEKKKKAPEENTVLSARDLWFRYERNGEDVVRGLDMTVNEGELYALLGGNGVGKTTLLKLITRQVKAQRGTVAIGGRRLETLSDKELFHNNISLLPQNPQALFTEITAREELIEALSDIKLPEDEKLARVNEMLEAMELSPLRENHPYDLSGGEQQRLALGKILLRKPKILLLDEPTKGLDPFFKRKLAQIFTGLKSDGVTILMVSHDIEFCAEYADRCALAFDGGIVAAGVPKEFFAGNSFYTTAANRLAGSWFPDAVKWEEVASLCAGA
ncbi:MAG: ATP-binding cassette domain-containing protein [Oscillospiraceae bacterium]|nr:ATP-binding cassette domain-containing protein [Oscillospiraceae bacterium]